MKYTSLLISMLLASSAAIMVQENATPVSDMILLQTDSATSQNMMDAPPRRKSDSYDKPPRQGWIDEWVKPTQEDATNSFINKSKK